MEVELVSGAYSEKAVKESRARNQVQLASNGSKPEGQVFDRHKQVPKQRESSKRQRARIMKAALTAFGTQGYFTTSIDDIASASNCSRGLLYYHFSSKADIFYHIHLLAMDTLLKRIRAIEAQSLSPLDRLAIALRNHVKFACDQQLLASITYRTFELRGLPKSYRARVIALRDEYEDMFRHLLLECQDQGLIARRDPGILVKIVLGACNSTVVWYRKGGRLSSIEIAEFISETIVNGLVHVPDGDLWRKSDDERERHQRAK